MECHRCEHQVAVKAGMYRGVDFAQTPCGKCELRDRTGYDLAYDEGRGAADDDRGLPAAAPRPAQLTLEETSTRDVPFPEEEIADDPVVPMSVMSDVIWRLLSMPPGMRDVICWRYAGRSYREIGRMLGMSMAAAEACHRRALTAWPALRVLFSEKVTKQVRRKPHLPAGGAETDGFEGDSGYSTGV